MQYIILNKKSFLILSVFGFLILCSCNNEPNQVRTTPPSPTKPPTPPKGPTTEPGLFYGNNFRVQNTSLYQNLMESCRRCGTRRLITGPGGTAYQRFWVSDSDPKRCKNWSTDGYIQIHFKENRLPTTAVVSIQPKYTGSNRGVPEWGEPFSVTAPANAINENKGFEILLSPSDGLGGVNTLRIKSEYSNHYFDHELDLVVIYGREEAQTIISEKIVKLQGGAITQSLFSCNTYTN